MRRNINLETKKADVALEFFKSASKTRLHYKIIPHELKQRRFQGLKILAPEIDLSRFRTNATIDWLEVQVVLQRKTNVMKLRHIVEQAGNTNIWVKNLGRESRYVSASWIIKFQNPERILVADAIHLLSCEFKLRGPASVNAMEVSIDFYPKSSRTKERLKMVGLLQRHLFLKHPEAWQPMGLPRSAARLGEVPFWINDDLGQTRAEKDPAPSSRSPFVDGTYQIGPQKKGVGWRVMDKTTDKRRSSTDFEALPLKQCRARVEVTLYRQEIDRLDIDTISDLRRFDFETLRRTYFPFYLPTFAMEEGSDSSSVSDHASRKRLLLEIGRFLDEGVMGVATGWGATRRTRQWRKRGKASSGVHRTISPPHNNGPLIEYSELNEKVRGALRYLRW
ncbi:hypothetical protein [Limibacillus halophilus]|uniref:Uncharacterized protein n=1 Tax=Limibacillus halophilus TaxID=1579333 RepID=A0A839SU45_9PROT|nr:hypothetical protein [Limibacillus halophilus]MBB3066012.1 hypothetical protein [Limibacillus halophilus]